jgi:hypothetical protein
MISVNKSIEHIRKVWTVLDKEGENLAYLSIPYDQNSSVTIKQIVIYDSNGKKIKSVKQADIVDIPAYSSFELFSEDRIRYFKPEQPEYPYTISYEYVLNCSNIISFAIWRPFGNYNVSAQHARLTIIHPAKVKINKKEIKVKQTSSEVQKDDVIETWELNNIPALEREPYSFSISERISSVYLMPEALIYYNNEGSARNWQEYGRWVYSLYRQRDELSELEKPKINLLLKDIPDTLDRIRALYKYVQENTRYVSITLGAGGFQPFDAKTVFGTGYGDCKALSNYMYSLLKFIGVKSYPALVASGTYIIQIFPEFPSFQQFDHVILCVPQKKDTIWLECTNQKIPFGFLGDFTDGREVLLITENGGVFAHTTKYNSNDNLRVSKTEFIIDPDGTANCTSEVIFKGLQYDNLTGFVNSNYDEQKKWLYDRSTLPSYQLLSFAMNENRSRLPVLKINENSKSKSYCSFSGQYMILPLNLINAQDPLQKMLKPRYSDILLSRSFTDCDTMVYYIPKNFRVESLPSGIKIDSQFGTFSYSVSGSENKIVYIRRFTVNEGRYKPAEYKNLYEFLLAVSKADNTKVILTKKI